MCARYVKRFAGHFPQRGVPGHAEKKGWRIPPNSATDTAWDLRPHPPEYGRKRLLFFQPGGNEERKTQFSSRFVPILPFFRMAGPRASIAKDLGVGTTAPTRTASIGLLFFINPARLSVRKNSRYLSGICKGTGAFLQRPTTFSRFLWPWKGWTAARDGTEFAEQPWPAPVGPSSLQGNYDISRVGQHPQPKKFRDGLFRLPCIVETTCRRAGRFRGP